MKKLKFPAMKISAFNLIMGSFMKKKRLKTFSRSLKWIKENTYLLNDK